MILNEAGAILVSALGVMATLVVTSCLARRRAALDSRLAQCRATLDILLTEEVKPEWAKQRTALNKLIKQGNISKWATKTRSNTPQAELLRTILNRYELVSIGIHRGIIDEDSYRDWCRTALVEDWIACKDLVVSLRENNDNPTCFCEFEKLAKRWATPEEERDM